MSASTTQNVGEWDQARTDTVGRESFLTFGECHRGHIRHVHAEEQVLLGLDEEPWEVPLHGSELLNLVFHRREDLSKTT